MASFTIKKFKEKYSDEETCLQALMDRSYGKNPQCSRRKKPTTYYRVKNRKCYECQWCGEQVSPTAGTIFHKSKTPLTDWFYVIYLMTAAKSDISAKEVERQIGVTYKCAWRMCHQIRRTIQKERQNSDHKKDFEDLLSRIVEKSVSKKSSIPGVYSI